MRTASIPAALSTLLLVAASALLVGCSAGDDAAAPTATASSAATASAAPTESATATAAPTSDSASSGAPSESASATTAAAEPDAATRISYVWPDQTWSIEDQDVDLCAMSGGYVAQSTDQPGFFVCGPTAASVEACEADASYLVTCILDAPARMAIRFQATPETAAITAGEVPADPSPLYVRLENGAECASLSHDHDQHWNGTLSWFYCTDGSELLTTDYDTDTFDRTSDRWIVHRSVDKAAPEDMAVAEAYFAGH